MMHDAIKRKKGKWYRAVNRYRMDLGLSWDDLFDMDRDTLKKHINKYDTDLWEKGMKKQQGTKILCLGKESYRI